MAMIPVICSQCGTVFGSPNLIGGNASSIQFENVGVGPCPKCGGTGKVPDGTYDLQDDTLKVVQSSGIPAPALQGLIDLLESLQRGDASNDEVMERVEADAPALAPTVRNVLAKSDPAQWIALLIAVIALYLQGIAKQPPSADEVANAIRAKPVPTYAVPAPNPAAKSKPKRKRPSKTHGEAKQRKSRKRR
jgi:hypothetical protein